jgi:hypothetical protein
MLQAQMSKSEFLKKHLRSGETYGGIVLGKRDYHIILAARKPIAEFASVKLDDYRVPNRLEFAILTANLPDKFLHEWYWTSERHRLRKSHGWVKHGGTHAVNFAPVNQVFATCFIRKVYIK